MFEGGGVGFVAPSLVPLDPVERTSFDDYFRQCLSWVGSVSGPVVLVGASMGAVLALAVAQGVSVGGVVMVSGAPPAAVGSFPVREYADVVRWAGGPVEETRAALPDGEEATVRFAAERWRDESGAVLRCLRSVKVAPPRCPCLVVHGTEDSDVPASFALATAEWASADLLLYSGMSHLGPLLGTRAAEVAGAVLGWIRGLETRR